MKQFIKKIVCTNCGSDNKWQILNDSGNIIAWCDCGNKSSIGVYREDTGTGLDTQAKVLNEKELGQWLNISNWTVRAWRLQGGLPFIKVGKRIFYNVAQVKKWLNDCKTNHKEEEDPWEIVNGKQRGYGTIRKVR